MDNIIHHNRKYSFGKLAFQLLFLILICCVLLLSSIKYIREYETLIQKKTPLEQSIDKLSNPAGIEYEVRERYRVVKPGEELILVIDNKQPTETTETMGFWNNLLETVLFWK